ncbi:DNA breaking-rejoining enzyme [Mycena galericulata]|nr:DNA breaking-rejoining enzyme [Mycena galericulata]
MPSAADDDDGDHFLENVDPAFKVALKNVREADQDSELEMKLKIASIRAISQRVAVSTADGYASVARDYKKYVLDHKLILDPTEVFEKPHPHSPWFIIEWISSKCDTVDTNGQAYPSNRVRATFGYANTMRSAVLYQFGTVQGFGKTPWHQSGPDPLHWVGNPAVFDAIENFLISMRRRKVSSGEVCHSSRAMTEAIFLKKYNHLTSLPATAKTWCHINQLIQLHCLETMAFHCMFRSAEVLRVRWADIEFIEDAQGNCTKAKITIKTRKTSPFGEGIKPYWIHLLPVHLSHICPLRALCYYAALCRHTTGYLFRNINKSGQITSVNMPISSSKYLKMMRQSLIDVQVDPTMFGTHCLRRGGVQYHYQRRVSIEKICLWGGWSTDFSISSVWRYIVAFIDENDFNREEFLNPNQPEAPCWSCGRSCTC